MKCSATTTNLDGLTVTSPLNDTNSEQFERICSHPCVTVVGYDLKVVIPATEEGKRERTDFEVPPKGRDARSADGLYIQKVTIVIGEVESSWHVSRNTADERVQALLKLDGAVVNLTANLDIRGSVGLERLLGVLVPKPVEHLLENLARRVDTLDLPQGVIDVLIDSGFIFVWQILLHQLVQVHRNCGSVFNLNCVQMLRTALVNMEGFGAKDPFGSLSIEQVRELGDSLPYPTTSDMPSDVAWRLYVKRWPSLGLDPNAWDDLGR